MLLVANPQGIMMREIPRGERRIHANPQGKTVRLGAFVARQCLFSHRNSQNANVEFSSEDKRLRPICGPVFWDNFILSHPHFEVCVNVIYLHS